MNNFIKKFESFENDGLFRKVASDIKVPSWYDRTEVEITSFVGKTITSIEGMENGKDTIRFICDDGSEFYMLHEQDCCESVEIVDVVGDVEDLIGSPILTAKETTNEGRDGVREDGSSMESYTYTFYDLATRKGFVTLRWLGESNGYYSESVYIYLKK